ncbi:MAG: hypothetical protein MZW92_65450 [Comamonadaceae bacterium]|nr:hypothetical protein [Comamonadaceae bacterium]
MTNQYPGAGWTRSTKCLDLADRKRLSRADAKRGGLQARADRGRAAHRAAAHRRGRRRRLAQRRDDRA